MPITDLTNTSWYFNETLDHCGISNQESFEIGAMAAEFMINYYAGNNYPYTSLYYEFSMSDNVYYDPNYDPTYDFVPYEGGSWTDEDCRTIWITGGDDATNPDLISWLTQNATQVENPTVITDVTNTSWHFNEVLHHWNVGEVDEEESSVRYNDFRNITFNANGENFNYLGYRGHRHDDFVSGTPLTVSYNETNVYDTDSWVDEAYKTITVTGGDDATNPKFIVWLTKNATQVSIEDTPSGITISYNGNIIATVQSGEIATLQCVGMKMKDNIVVEVSEGSEKYNGLTIVSRKEPLDLNPSGTIPEGGRIEFYVTSSNRVTLAAGDPFPADMSVYVNNSWVTYTYNDCTYVYIKDYKSWVFLNIRENAPRDIQVLESIDNIPVTRIDGLVIFESMDQHVTSLTIPKCITYISFYGDGYVIGNKSLATINYSGSVTEWKNITFHKYWTYLCPEITVNCIDGIITIPAYKENE